MIALQKRERLMRQKRVNASKQRQQKANLDMEHIQSWIIGNTERLLTYRELKEAQITEMNNVKEVET